MTRNSKFILIMLTIHICSLVNHSIWWRTKSSETQRFTSNLDHLECCVLWKEFQSSFSCVPYLIHILYDCSFVYKCIYNVIMLINKTLWLIESIVKHSRSVKIDNHKYGCSYSFVIPLYFIFCKKKEERLGGRKQRYIYSYIIKFNTHIRCTNI